MELAITDITETDGRRVLRLSGAVDMLSREVLLEQASEAVKESPAAVVLDLAGVNFFDSTGIGALVQIAEATEDAGIGFALRNPSDRVRRVLQIAGLEETWTVEQVD